MNKAWSIVWGGMPAVVTYVAAPSRGAAHNFTFKQIRDADWEPTFTDFSARRAPQFDTLAAKENAVRSLGWVDAESGTAWGCGKPEDPCTYTN